jgi:hypothetical protein
MFIKSVLHDQVALPSIRAKSVAKGEIIEVPDDIGEKLLTRHELHDETYEEIYSWEKSSAKAYKEQQEEFEAERADRPARSKPVRQVEKEDVIDPPKTSDVGKNSNETHEDENEPAGTEPPEPEDLTDPDTTNDTDKGKQPDVANSGTRLSSEGEGSDPDAANMKQGTSNEDEPAKPAAKASPKAAAKPKAAAEKTPAKPAVKRVSKPATK